MKFKDVMTAVAACVMLLGLASCSSLMTSKTTEEKMDFVPVTRICDYVVDAGTYTELDYELADRFFRDVCDKWYGGCTAVAKVTDDGTMLVGRNMDLTITNKPAYVIRTKVEGCYETIGLSYVHSHGDDYQVVLDRGVDPYFHKLIPFLSCDVMNSQGLYIETNMRPDEYYANGNTKFGCSGTNPGSDLRICALNLPRYLGEYCATVDEVLEAVKKIDIYTITDHKLAWNFCFILADSSGHYGLLEIADNKVVWHEKQPAQANFYITKEFRDKEELPCGLGRYETVMNGIDSVQNSSDMFALMDKVSYFQLNFPESCPIDVRSEQSGARDYWTYSYLMDEKNREEIMSAVIAAGEKLRTLSRQEVQDRCEYWESVFTEVANCTDRTLFVRFFEDNERTLTLSFDK